MSFSLGLFYSLVLVFSILLATTTLIFCHGYAFLEEEQKVHGDIDAQSLNKGTKTKAQESLLSGRFLNLLLRSDFFSILIVEVTHLS